MRQLTLVRSLSFVMPVNPASAKSCCRNLTTRLLPISPVNVKLSDEEPPKGSAIPVMGACPAASTSGTALKVHPRKSLLAFASRTCWLSAIPGQSKASERSKACRREFRGRWLNRRSWYTAAKRPSITPIPPNATGFDPDPSAGEPRISAIPNQ